MTGTGFHAAHADHGNHQIGGGRPAQVCVWGVGGQTGGTADTTIVLSSGTLSLCSRVSISSGTAAFYFCGRPVRLGIPTVSAGRGAPKNRHGNLGPPATHSSGACPWGGLCGPHGGVRRGGVMHNRPRSSTDNHPDRRQGILLPLVVHPEASGGANTARPLGRCAAHHAMDDSVVRLNVVISFNGSTAPKHGKIAGPLRDPRRFATARPFAPPGARQRRLHRSLVITGVHALRPHGEHARPRQVSQQLPASQLQPHRLNPAPARPAPWQTRHAVDNSVVRLSVVTVWGGDRRAMTDGRSRHSNIDRWAWPSQAARSPLVWSTGLVGPSVFFWMAAVVLNCFCAGWLVC
eukprot:gene24785-biopygen10463